MKIGFDAKRAFQNTRGLGNYSRNLLSGLLQYQTKHEYYLFGKQPQNTDIKNWYTTISSQIQLISPKTGNKVENALWRSWLMHSDIKKNKLDIYHGLSHEIPKGIPNTVKKVVTIHDLLFLRFKENFSVIDRKIYTSKIKHSCQHSDLIIAISEQTKRDLIDLLQVPENKIKVHYQSCSPLYYNELSDIEKDVIREKYCLPQEYLLFVGALVKHKNIERIIASIAHLKSDKDIPLVLVAKENAYKKELLQLAQKLKIEHRLIFIDYVPSIDLPGIYQCAKLLIWPSLFEGFGIPIIESLFSKTPVITSNAGVFREVGGPNTAYVDPYSVTEIATAIDTVLGNRNRYNKMIDEGFNFVQKFHIKKTTQQLEDLYQSL